MSFGYFPPRNLLQVLLHPVANWKAWRRGQDNLIKRLSVVETFRHLDLKPDDRVLEIGAGGLHFAGEIARRAGSVVAVDVAPNFEKQVEWRRFPPNLRAQRADCANLPYADGTFDKVFISELFPVLEHEKAQRCANEAYRVLRSGGKLITVHGRHFDRMEEVLRSEAAQALLARRGASLSYDEFRKKYLNLHKTKSWFFGNRDEKVRDLLLEAGFADLEMTWTIGPDAERELCLILLENYAETGSLVLGENQVRYLDRVAQLERGRTPHQPGFTLYCSGYRR